MKVSKMTKRLTTFFGALAVASSLAVTAQAAGSGENAALPPRTVAWSFEGPFGSFDRAALQRGFQVYREVCAACHSLDYIAFRNLADDGGPGFTEDAVKALAAEYTVEDGPDEFGDMFERAGKPSDYFPAPYPNENAARAGNGGAFPPDLSLIAKARVNGPNYIYSLLTGYTDAPAEFDLGDGLSYNAYFKNRQIAMAEPLIEDLVEYADGTPAGVDQMASDVTQFLMWTAEPKLEERKGLAIPTLLYLLVLAVLLYMSYKKVWRDVEKD